MVLYVGTKKMIQSLQRVRCKNNRYYRQDGEEGKCLPTAGLPAVLLRKGVADSAGRGGGTGSEQDAITELEKGFLTAPAATFGKRPWDSKGSDETHFSYFTMGNISSSRFPKGMVVTAFSKKGRQTMAFKGIVLLLTGTKPRPWACSSFSLSLSSSSFLSLSCSFSLLLLFLSF